MHTALPEIIGAIIGSNSIAALALYIVTRYNIKHDKISSTLVAVTYSMLSDKIERLVERGYATSEERNDIEVLRKCYSGLGGNGDMEERISKVYALPLTKAKRSGK